MRHYKPNLRRILSTVHGIWWSLAESASNTLAIVTVGMLVLGFTLHIGLWHQRWLDRMRHASGIQPWEQAITIEPVVPVDEVIPVVEPMIAPVVQRVEWNAQRVTKQENDLNMLRETVLRQAQEVTALRDYIKGLEAKTQAQTKATEDTRRYVATVSRTLVKEQNRRERHPTAVVVRPAPGMMAVQ